MELLLQTANVPPHLVRLHLAILDLRETCRGINAPTVPFNFAGMKPFELLGLSVPEILYLMAVLWYLVGYFREQRNTQKNPAVSIAILLWGMILMCLCIVLMREAFLWRFFFPVRFLNALLYAWTEEMHGSD